MYYPLQIPSILDKSFIQKVEYQEYQDPTIEKYCMCIWSMKSYRCLEEPVNNIILPDGCIDLLLDFSEKKVYFTGNSKTSLHFPLVGEVDFMGIRMKPGVFYHIFEFDCSQVMDLLVPYEKIETKDSINAIFDCQGKEERRLFLIEYLRKKGSEQKSDPFSEKLNAINAQGEMKFVNELAQYFGYSNRQLNRIFKERCGVSVKVFLNIIRLHNSLKLMMNQQTNKLINLALESGFYDEAHFIKEIKKYCGIAPTDLLKRYHMS